MVAVQDREVALLQLAERLQARHHDAVEDLALHGGDAEAEHAPRHRARERRGAARQDLDAALQVRAALAKSLLAEVVGHADALQFEQRVARDLRVAILGAAQRDREAIAAQVPHLELVGVPRDVQHLPVGALKAARVVVVDAMHRDPLAAHGLLVLQAGDANRARVHFERGAELVDEIDRREPALLDPQEQVLAVLLRFVGRDLVDDEVLGFDLVAAGQKPVAGAARDGTSWFEVHRAAGHCGGAKRRSSAISPSWASSNASASPAAALAAARPRRELRPARSGPA